MPLDTHALARALTRSLRNITQIMKKSITQRTWKLKVKVDGGAEHFLSSALRAFAAATKRQLVCDDIAVQEFTGAGGAGAAEDDEDEEDCKSRMWAMLMRQLCDPAHGLFERCAPADAASSLVPCARVDEDSGRHRHVGPSKRAPVSWRPLLTPNCERLATLSRR